MTVTIQLEPFQHRPSSSGTAYRGSHGQEWGLEDVLRAVRRARRIVVVCGAGISTAAFIPDFRSSTGLFASSSLSSSSSSSSPVVRGDRKGKAKQAQDVKDLFHIKALSSPTLLAKHHLLLNELASLSMSAEPTDFHTFLAGLDGEGRLLRCYTQNIDGLEGKTGMTVGLPTRVDRLTPRKRVWSRTPSAESSGTPCDAPTTKPQLARSQPHIPAAPPTPPGSQSTPGCRGEASPARSLYQPYPRVIPLHGILDRLHCPLCSTSVPLGPYLPLPTFAIACPTCSLSSSIRSALSERQRKAGHLRASIVLYGEEHPQGELIGQVVERDLKGLGKKDEREGKVDLLLVAGTSLSIPGVKRIIKEMSRSLHQDSSEAEQIKAIYVNAEAPSKAVEWEDTFDIWVKEDIQAFASLASGPDPSEGADTMTPIKSGKKSQLPTPKSIVKQAGKRTAISNESITTPIPKRRKATNLPTPRSTPPSPSKMHFGGPCHDPRRIFEESLTPISDDESQSALVPEGGEEEVNPFL